MTGLQSFILAMIRTPQGSLLAADPAKLAAKYEISADVARFYLEHWISR